MATMLFESRGSLVIWVGGNDVPTDEEWIAYIACLEKIAKRRGVRVLVVPEGEGAPTPLQRRVLADALYRLPHRAAVLTSNIIAHGVTTVMRWMGGDIHAFTPAKRDAACAYLSVTTDERAWLDAREPALREKLRAKSVAA